MTFNAFQFFSIASVIYIGLVNYFSDKSCSNYPEELSRLGKAKSAVLASWRTHKNTTRTFAEAEYITDQINNLRERCGEVIKTNNNLRSFHDFQLVAVCCFFFLAGSAFAINYFFKKNHEKIVKKWLEDKVTRTPTNDEPANSKKMR